MTINRFIEHNFDQIINHLPTNIQPWFYRTQQGAECDLVLEKNGQVIAAIEIKHSTNPIATKGFRISMEDTAAQKGYIIGKGESTYQLEPHINVTNLQDFIRQIIPSL